jgi:hypothetical protein
VYKGRLHDLGLVCSRSRAHWSRRRAIRRCVAHFAIRTPLVCGRAVYRGRAHGRRRRGRDVHGIAWRGQRRARGGQDGYRLVHIGAVRVWREGAPASLCNRRHHGSAAGVESSRSSGLVLRRRVDDSEQLCDTGWASRRVACLATVL